MKALLAPIIVNASNRMMAVEAGFATQRCSTTSRSFAPAPPPPQPGALAAWLSSNRRTFNPFATSNATNNHLTWKLLRQPLLPLQSQVEDDIDVSCVEDKSEDMDLGEFKTIDETTTELLSLTPREETSNASIIENSSSIDATNTPESSTLKLWGIPLQSILLLNLVAIIWGTQHSVIKSVVDDSPIGLGTGMKEWFEHWFVVKNLENAQTTGGSPAAYFTLARFGLAAILASPYTPGLQSLFVKRNREPIDEEESTPDDANDRKDLLPEQIKTPPTQQLATSATSQVDTTHADNSVTLAWIYGVELGIYMFLGYAFQAIGLETTTASRSGFLLYLNVKFVPFLSFLIFGKRIRNSTWFSALVAFTGTALLSLDNAGDTGSDGLNMSFTVGDLWSIAAAVASAMFILRMEAASKAVTKSSELNAANLWTVALLSLVWTMGISMNSSDGSTVAIATQQTFQRTLDTIVKHPLPLLYLSAVTTALANYIQSKAQKDVSAERASVIYAMDPVYGALFANILLGEQLGGWGWVGAGLIAFAAATNAIWDFGGLDEEDVDA
jgi:drug/metabolite transporter (DMT)-like permease